MSGSALFYVQRGKLWKRLAKRQRHIAKLREGLQNQLRALECELQYVRSQRDDNESAWQAEKQKREAALAEVARLRELAEHRGKLLVKQLEATQSEARAHEATKAAYGRLHGESAGWCDELRAAGARVAELERDLKLSNDRFRERCDELLQQDAAIDQARGLLHEAGDVRADWNRRRWQWLRAHPEPATPAETPEQVCERLGIDVAAWAAEVRAKVVAAAPAATGAEHVYVCPACGKPSGSPPPAEKEQGT